MDKTWQELLLNNVLSCMSPFDIKFSSALWYSIVVEGQYGSLRRSRQKSFDILLIESIQKFANRDIYSSLNLNTLDVELKISPLEIS